jgi:catechol 2,3-dioxygenase-like lactoylglutathione lyase family enzyme
VQIAEIAIFTDHVEQMTQFYQRLLGRPPAHAGEGLAIFDAGQAQLLIHRRYVPGPGELPPENHVAFSVADVDAAASGLEQRGLRLEVPPRDYPWGRSAYLRDPEGRLLELQQGR